MKYLRGYLLTGLVVWLPVLVTIVVLRFIVDLLDGTISLLPDNYQPDQLLGFHVPGLGVIFSLLVLLVTGVIGTNILGQKLMRWSEALLDKIPLVRTVYNGAKQMIQAVFATNSNAFRKVLLVEYPRKGMWSLAFQAGSASIEIANHVGSDMISIFIPTTPNPTAGFMLMVSKADVIELTMSIDEALKLVISLGVIQPPKS